MGLVAKKRKNSLAAGPGALAGIAEALVSRMPHLAPEMTGDITRALHDMLGGHDEQSRHMRIGLQHYLIEAAEFQGTRPRKPSDATMLTTEGAAELMQCSRPYVAMLIDNKKLAGAFVTEGGHRRVPESSVRAWIKEREAMARQSDYRAAAAEADMYAVPEKVFVETKARRRS
jgi:excisionase family DNA binding protein